METSFVIKNISIHTTINSLDYLDIIDDLCKHLEKLDIPLKENVTFYFWYSKMRFKKEHQLLIIEEYIEIKNEWTKNISRALAYWKRQKDLTIKFWVSFHPVKNDLLVAYWGEIFNKKSKIELLHYEWDEKNSWWIIVTDDYNEKVNNFKFLHLSHIIEKNVDFIDLFWLPIWTFIKINSDKDTEIWFNLKLD